jgi:hypothetical protein
MVAGWNSGVACHRPPRPIRKRENISMSSALSPEETYCRIGWIIEECPSFAGIADLSAKQLTWLGRAEALIEASGEKFVTASPFTDPEAAARKLVEIAHTRRCGTGASTLSFASGPL